MFLADSLRFPVARWSNSVTSYKQLPPARQQTKAYVSAISQLVTTHNIHHIIPTCEEAFYIAKYKHHWQNCTVWVADSSLMEALHNKQRFAETFGGQLNIPETIPLTHFSEWENSKQYVFKPNYSRFGNQTIIDQSITAETIKEPEGWIAQKKVNGKEVCVYSIWMEGQLKGYACYAPRYKAGKGSGIFFEAVENEKLKAKVAQFGKANNYTGQLSFDVILTEKDAYFIECNPRGTSGAHLLNKHLSACFFNQKELVIAEKQNYMLSSLMLLSKPAAFTRKMVRQAKSVIFRWNDWQPALFQLVSMAELFSISLRKGISLLQATTHDIEWNGDED